MEEKEGRKTMERNRLVGGRKWEVNAVVHNGLLDGQISQND